MNGILYLLDQVGTALAAANAEIERLRQQLAEAQERAANQGSVAADPGAD